MTRSRSEQGNILISALLVLVAMNLLGVGLVYSSVRESSMATYKTIDSITFHISESCTRNSIQWLSQLDAAPDGATLPYEITTEDLESLRTGQESSAAMAKLSGYRFECSVSYINALMAEGSEESGEEIGEGSGYSGLEVPRYYYQIESVGYGPKESVKRTYAIVSVNY